MTGSRSKVIERPMPIDDPRKRQPDISLARQVLRWEPKVPLAEGLEKTIEHFAGVAAAGKTSAAE
jgi:UDP-glucuronate decarboxylase